MTTTHHIPLSEDAALVTALAGTAMPFSQCAEDEAERWLRALRLHGQVGRALQALGVGESPLESDDVCEQPAASPALGQTALNRAVGEAERRAVERGANAIGTTDLLLALLDVYGEPMEQALEQRGATRDEVVERLSRMGDQPELRAS